jgi:hypothetical protein
MHFKQGKPEQFISLPFSFRTAVIRIMFSLIEDVAGCTGEKPETR